LAKVLVKIIVEPYLSSHNFSRCFWVSHLCTYH